MHVCDKCHDPSTLNEAVTLLGWYDKGASAKSMQFYFKF